MTAVDHAIYRITDVAVIGPHALRLSFDDGLTRTIDLKDVLAGELYGPLQDSVVFAQVTINPEVETIEWPNGADFDPATLHDWPEHEPAWRARAELWRTAAAVR